MDDIFGKVVSITLAAIFFCLMPFYTMTERQKNASQLYLLSESTRFIDCICNTGFVSEQMLLQYYQQIAVAPQRCEIQLVHESKELVYDDKKDCYTQISTYHDEEDIWNSIQEHKKYIFAKNDFIQVVISCCGEWNFLPGQEDATMNIRYGGVVRFENN